MENYLQRLKAVFKRIWPRRMIQTGLDCIQAHPELQLLLAIRFKTPQRGMWVCLSNNKSQTAGRLLLYCLDSQKSWTAYCMAYAIHISCCAPAVHADYSALVRMASLQDLPACTMNDHSQLQTPQSAYDGNAQQGACHQCRLGHMGFDGILGTWQFCTVLHSSPLHTPHAHLVQAGLFNCTAT